MLEGLSFPSKIQIHLRKDPTIEKKVTDSSIEGAKPPRGLNCCFGIGKIMFMVDGRVEGKRERSFWTSCGRTTWSPTRREVHNKIERQTCKGGRNMGTLHGNKGFEGHCPRRKSLVTVVPINILSTCIPVDKVTDP